MSRSGKTSGAVFLIISLGLVFRLQGEQVDSTLLRKPQIYSHLSPWIVNPFPDISYRSPFSIDSVSTVRGMLRIDHDDVEQWQEIESDWSLITLYETVDGTYLRIPFSAPLSWFIHRNIIKTRFNAFYHVFKRRDKEEKKRTRGKSIEVLGVETGVGRVTVNINGNVNITGKMVFQDQELARSTLQESQSTFFEFDQRQHLNVEGKIGDRISILLDQDSEREFDWENNIRIHYTGDEDEIVQRIEAGNISLSLPSTQFVSFSGSNKGLFGLKSIMKFGPVDVTAIASIERTKKEKKKFTGGSETSGQTILDYQYRKNQYFFINEVFRNGGFVLDDSGVDSSFVPSFYPLVDGKHRIGNVVISEIEVFRSVGAATGSGTYYGVAFVDPNHPESHKNDAEGSFFQRLERNADYTVSEDLGYIRLATPVQNEILAVSYILSLRGETKAFRHIGQLTSGVTDTTSLDTIRLKMLKPSIPNPGHPTWPLAFKNVYYLGATNINREGFKVDIIFKNGVLGNDERDENGNTFLKLFGLDQVDGNSNPTPDDLIDKMNSNIVILTTGELFFPMLHPFEMDTLGSEKYYGEGNSNEALRSILPDSASMYRSLNPQNIHKDSQFEIKVQYTNKSSTINLGFMLVEGSEEVRIDGKPLTRNKDYAIDYFSGTLTFLPTEKTSSLDDPTSELEILYDKHELVSFDKKTIIGARAQMDLGEKSFIGGTALYYNQSVINEKIEVGYEPTRNFIWDLNGKYNRETNFLTEAIDKLPLIETTKPSSFTIEGEIAQVLPNPNPVNNPKTGDPHGVAFIDDFEGSKRVTSPSISYRVWHYSSTPEDLNPRNRATMFWYNPYTQWRTQDIWPNQQTSFRAQNDLTDVLFLNFTRRNQQISDGVDPDSTWAGITTNFFSSDYNQSQSKFFEIWLYGDQGKMRVDLGFVSEDQNGNRALDTEDKPKAGLLTGDTYLDKDEDIGLDGCGDPYEDGYGGCLDTTYQAARELGYDVYIGDDLDPDDPNNDNFSYKWRGVERSAEYRHRNGTEGNGFPKDDSPPQPKYPDSEDINRDGNFDSKDDYFTIAFDLDRTSNDWKDYKGGETETGWRMYRIPLTAFKKAKKDGTITWETIKFMRLILSGIEEHAEVRIAKIELVGNEWQELGVRSTDSQEYSENDSVFAVTVMNTDDNAEDYNPPKGAEGEYDRINEIRLKEQSLVLKFTNLEPNQEGAAQKSLVELKGDRAQSFMAYKYMKMYLYGNSFYAGSDSTSVEFFIKFGRADDFYEIRQPVYEGWDEEKKRNHMKLNLDFLARLKQGDSQPVELLDSHDRFIVTDSSREYIATANDGADTLRKILIHGKPALNRIQYFVVGVRNKNPTQPISGQVWIDELRLSGVRKDAGTAMRIQSSLRLADLGSATLSYSRKDADFHVLQKRLGSSKTSEKLRIDGRLNVNKLFPNSWGLNIPINASFTKNVTTPKYLPGTDIFLNRERAPDSVLTKSQQISVGSSFGKSTKSDRWLTRYTADRIKANFSGTHSWSSNEQIGRQLRKNYSAGTSYNLTFGRDNYWTPLKFLKEIPWLGNKIGNTHLYYSPSSVDLSANATESSTEIMPRKGEITSRYDLSLTRNFKVGYRVFENLNANYSKAMKSDMDQYKFRYLEAIKGLKPGVTTDVTENLSTSFTPTIFNWLKPSLNYTANYRWSKPIESTQEGANIASQRRFSSSVTISPKSIVEVFYTPQKKARGRGRKRRGRGKSNTVDRETKQAETKKPKSEKMVSFLKLLYDGAGRISPISFSYSQNLSQNSFGVLGTADIRYRLGFTNDLSREHSEEVGVNRESIKHGRDFSFRSGLSLTRKITANFSFSRSRSDNIGGNNIRTSSETLDYFPMGDAGDKGLPFIGWTVRWSGIERWPLLSSISRSATLEHAFSGKETRSWQNDDLQSSRYTASYSPLIGISMTMLKGITFSTRFSNIRTIDNKFGGITSTKVKTDKTWTASMNYSHRGGLNIPIFFFRDLNLENTVSFNLTFDSSSSRTKERNVADVKLTPTGWRKGWKISPRISYSFTRRVTGGIWYEYRENESKLGGRRIDRDFGFDVNIAIQG